MPLKEKNYVKNCLEDSPNINEAKYRKLLESTNNLIVQMDDKLNILYINKILFSKLFNYDYNDFEKRKLLNLIHPEDRQNFINEMGHIFRGEQRCFNLRIKNKNGNYIWFEINGISDRDRRNINAILIAQEITEIINMYKKLEKTRKKYLTIIKDMGEGYYEIDLEGTFFFVNKRFCEIMGYSEEELIGNNYKSFFEGASNKFLFEKFNKVFTTRIPYPPQTEFKIRTKNDRIIYFEGLIDLLYNSEGKRVGFYGFVRKINQRKKAQRELRETKTVLDSLKDLFAHDINNILQSIYSVIRLMNMSVKNKGKEIDPKTMLNFIKTIEKLIFRANKLSKDVISITKIENSEFRLKKTEIIALLEKAKKFVIQSYPQKNINITIEDKNHKRYVNGNEFLQDVFENILINAVKYNKQEIVEINVKINEKDNLISIEFIDNGIGISDEEKEQIFQARGDTRETLDNMKGLGLGLSLVKKIILKCQGEIWAEKRESDDSSMGTKFIINLPTIY
ncbi:MAG: PAS domain-containing sensor histidine kinase [Promethearchaeota archaeon]|nr:MAG: PAS domain-containing sensor histidine kinase [Candidatus Lokiarchaeota archaeon]